MICFRKNNKKGQVAPFMIAVIVILITAIMAAVNLGKISSTKTTTANAADAGALAGASTMANGLNSLKDMSTDTFMATFSAEAILMSCKLECDASFYSWIATMATSAAWYAYILAKVVPDARKAAENAAKQTAFSNAGIDETKTRLSGENYEVWLKKDSNFTIWMDDNRNELPDTYKWFDSDIKYGQESKPPSQRRNAVTVKVDIPKWIAFPLPMWLGAIGWICTPECHCSMSCFHWWGGAIWGLSVVTGADDPIKVRVSRVEPGNNLGLWTMRYSKQGQSDITSSAEAQAYGGSVLPHGKDYDSRLTSAN